MFSFVKMKFKTYNQVRSKICKEKSKSISHKGQISQTGQTHQEDEKTPGWSKVSQASDLWVTTETKWKPFQACKTSRKSSKTKIPMELTHKRFLIEHMQIWVDTKSRR